MPSSRPIEVTTRLDPAALVGRVAETARCGDLVRIRATPDEVRAFVVGSGPFDVPLRVRTRVEPADGTTSLVGDVRPSLLIALVIAGACAVFVPLAALQWNYGAWVVGLGILMTLGFGWRRSARSLDDRRMQEISDDLRLLVRAGTPPRSKRKKSSRKH